MSIDYLANENWKTIPEYPDYMISDLGRVYSVKRRKVLRPFSNGHYLIVRINGNNLRVHRLVAESFLENPEGKKYTHHRNCNALDNRVVNLQWVTAEEHVLIHRKIREERKAEVKENVI